MSQLIPRKSLKKVVSLIFLSKDLACDIHGKRTRRRKRSKSRIEKKKKNKEKYKQEEEEVEEELKEN